MSTAPMLGTVEMRLSDDDRRAIATLVAAELAERMQLTDEALSALRPAKVAELLDVAPATVVDLERRGIITPFVREGRLVRFSRQHLASVVNGGHE